MEVVKDPGNNRDQVLVQMVNQYQGLLLRMCYIYLRDMELAKLFSIARISKKSRIQLVMVAYPNTAKN